MATRVLLDSNILILASINKVAIQRIAARYDDILLSIVSEVEVLGFNFPDAAELGRAQRAVSAMQVLPFTSEEAQYAIAYRKLKKIKFPDAAILATARAAGADLLTQSTADFRGLDAAVRVLTIEEL